MWYPCDMDADDAKQREPHFISGLPYTPNASSRQSTQNDGSLLLLIRQGSTRREDLSMIATRYTKLRASRSLVMSVLHTGFGLVTAMPRSR